MIAFLILFLAGCSIKPPIKQSQSVKVVFKSNAIKISDVGFLNYGDLYEHLQVLNLSKVILDIEAKEKDVCINGNCFEAKFFNQKILSPLYPDTLIKNILRFQPIFGARGIQYSEEGFTQKFANDSYDIIYTVTDTRVYFKDIKENILIRIERL